MATYRKRSDAWRAEICKNGVRQSATFNTKAEAVAWATSIENDINGGRLSQLNGTRTLAEVMERYKKEVSPTKAGVRWETVRIDAFIRSMKIIGARIDRITPDDLATPG